MKRKLLPAAAALAVLSVSFGASAQSVRDLAQMANVVYDTNPQSVFGAGCTNVNQCAPTGWTYVASRAATTKTRQALAAYTPKGTLVIAYRGTQPGIDFATDAGLLGALVGNAGCLRQQISSQTRRIGSVTIGAGTCTNPGLTPLVAHHIVDAEQFYGVALAAAKQQKLKVKQVVIAGHSLGGYIANIIGMAHQATTHSFNPAPGAHYALWGDPASYRRANRARYVTNHRRRKDKVSTALGLLGFNFNGTEAPYPYAHPNKTCLYKYVSGDAHSMTNFITDVATPGRLEGCKSSPTSATYW
ncbi:MAG: hypothetical protein R3B13_12585 [Polyangiaceae bacterium]